MTRALNHLYCLITLICVEIQHTVVNEYDERRSISKVFQREKGLS